MDQKTVDLLNGNSDQAKYWSTNGAHGPEKEAQAQLIYKIEI